MKMLYPLTNAEHATVLAALRYFQWKAGQEQPSDRFNSILNIATIEDEIDALGADDIDGLCEALNVDGLHLRKEKMEFYYALVNGEGATVAGVNLTHVNFTKELEALIGDPDPVGTADAKAGVYTNHYLCDNDKTRWDTAWSLMCNDKCPTCRREIEPYASTENASGDEVIHNQAVYNEANVLEDAKLDAENAQRGAAAWDALLPDVRIKIIDAAVVKLGQRVKAPTRYKMIHGRWDGLSKKAHRILLSVDWK